MKKYHFKNNIEMKVTVNQTAKLLRDIPAIGATKGEIVYILRTVGNIIEIIIPSKSDSVIKVESKAIEILDFIEDTTLVVKEVIQDIKPLIAKVKNLWRSIKAIFQRKRKV